MIHIPALRFGKTYTSLDKATLVHHVTGEPVAEVSQVTGSMIARDLSTAARAHKELAAVPVRDLLAMYKKAADYFLNAALPCGDAELTFDEYVRNLSATTGSARVFCDRNARKVHYVLDNIEEVIGGLTRGLDLEALDQGYTTRGGRMQAFYPTTDVFGAVLPSNSPGVHSLWVPAVAFKIPLLLKPGREEPWTPFRVLQAFIKAGVPATALAFLPTDHAGAADILRLCGRSMAFGDDRTMAPYKNDHRVEIHGTGYSKVILGADQADRWADHLDMMVEAVAANGGRACVNASAVWTPRNGAALAEGLAKRLAGVTARPADDPACQISAFANPAVAEAINAMIDEGLKTPGAVDVTEQLRGTPRLVKDGRCAWLLPTVVRCDSPDHPLANKEFLFPYASVIEWPQDDVLKRIGYTLAATVLSDDAGFIADCLACPTIERLNIGPLPTNRLTWDQPHEGNLFTHLYKQRALQHAPRLPPAFDVQPLGRVVFEPGGLAKLGEVARDLGARRVMLVTDPGLEHAGHPQRAETAVRAAGLEVFTFDGVKENPTEREVAAGVVFARTHRVDAIVAVGGGSSMDCAKGVNFLLTNGGRMADYKGFGRAAKPMLPSVGVPTTAGTGSEAQCYALITDEKTHLKMACGDKKAAFRVSILDPEVTLSQPRAVTAVTGIDAVAHAVETFVCTKRNPLSQVYSLAAFRHLEPNFGRVMADPADLPARAAMLLGAHFAGMAIESAMLGACHSCANPLTAHYGITHGVAVGVMLPHVVRFNAGDPAAARLYAELLGDRPGGNGRPAADALADRVTEFLAHAGLPRTLKECGVSQTILPLLAEEANEQWTARFNPRPVTDAEILQLYQAAW